MNVPLRTVLILLVLLDLAFVYITDAASLKWLLSLAVLTIVSPLLLALRRRILYRIAWNGAVIGAFSVLVHHATSGGVRYMLEDGLVLAALCQVHLLNNIGPEQKPDLLFFNSFLIPVVTGFLSLDQTYLILFTAYAPLLVLGLSLHVLAGEERKWSRPLFFAVLRGAAARSAVVLAITMLVFFFFPRDFHRKGLLGDRIRFQPGTVLNPGFTEEVDLERSGIAGSGGSRVVMTARTLDEGHTGLPEYWRGATLGRFDSREWHPVQIRGYAGEWVATGRAEWTRIGKRGKTAVEVDLRETRSHRIFLPGSTAQVRLLDAPGNPRLQLMPDGTAMLIGRATRGKVRYRVSLGSEPAPTGRAAAVDSLNLTGTVPAALQRLCRNLRKELPTRAPPRQIVEKFRSWLQANREYVPPGGDGGAKSLHDFVTGKGGGHCEFFATALVLMIRSEGFPARFVAGYRSVERDPENGNLVVRDRHAHAWVETYDPERGWTTVDATPPASEAGPEGRGPIAAIGAYLKDLWGSLTGFDRESRTRALAWLTALPERLLRFGRDHRGALAFVAVLLAGLLVLRRRKMSMSRGVRDYRRALRRAGMASLAGETPRELLARARKTVVGPKKLELLRRATQAHESERYRVTPGSIAAGARPRAARSFRP